MTKSNMKKVLVFTSTFPSFAEGDATPPFVYELSQRLAQKWLHISVLTPRVPWSKKYEIKDNIKIYRYPYFFRSSWEQLNNWAILPNIKKNKWLVFQIPFLLIAWFFALIKVTKKENIEIIHAHWLIPQWLLVCIYKKIWNKKIKILCTAHGSDIHSLWWKFMKRLQKFVLNTSDYITVVSHYLEDEARKLGVTKPIDVISMGVDTDKFNPNTYDENIKIKNSILDKFLLYVGRLAPEKGITYLLWAMPGIIKRYPQIKLMIIGAWPLEAQLKHQADMLHLQESLIRKGRIDHKDIVPYFATADIFILPSLKESFGLVLVEAMLSGSIVVASRLNGIWDIIQDKDNGFLVQPGESYDMENTLQYCLENMKILQSRKEESIIAIAKKFGWETISEKYFTLLK